jgi:hypothetical protein
MPKLVLARGSITNTDELVIVLSEPDNEPSAVLIVWPSAASAASPAPFPTTASKNHRRGCRRTARTAESEAFGIEIPKPLEHAYDFDGRPRRHERLNRCRLQDLQRRHLAAPSKIAES